MLKIILFAKKTLHFFKGRAFLWNSSNLTGRWHSRNKFIVGLDWIVSVSKVAAIQTFRSLVNEKIDLIDLKRSWPRDRHVSNVDDIYNHKYIHKYPTVLYLTWVTHVVSIFFRKNKPTILDHFLYFVDYRVLCKTTYKRPLQLDGFDFSVSKWSHCERIWGCYVIAIWQSSDGFKLV